MGVLMHPSDGSAGPAVARRVQRLAQLSGYNPATACPLLLPHRRIAKEDLIPAVAAQRPDELINKHAVEAELLSVDLGVRGAQVASGRSCARGFVEIRCPKPHG